MSMSPPLLPHVYEQVQPQRERESHSIALSRERERERVTLSRRVTLVKRSFWPIKDKRTGPLLRELDGETS